MYCVDTILASGIASSGEHALVSTYGSGSRARNSIIAKTISANQVGLHVLFFWKAAEILYPNNRYTDTYTYMYIYTYGSES